MLLPEFNLQKKSSLSSSKWWYQSVCLTDWWLGIYGGKNLDPSVLLIPLHWEKVFL